MATQAAGNLARFIIGPGGRVRGIVLHQGTVALLLPRAGAALAQSMGLGVPLRVVLFGGGGPNPRYPDAPAIPRTLLINPVLTPLGPERDEAWEGCLSVPGLRGRVPRWLRLRYQGLDGDGQPVDRCVEGFHARVVQHECDHLDGVLFPDRLSDPTAFGFIPELEAAGLIPAVPG